MPKMLDNIIVAAVPDTKTYSVAINWANGETTVSRFGQLMGRGVFAALLDPAVFAQVRVGDRGRSLEWPGEIDFCADALWFEAHPIIQHNAIEYKVKLIDIFRIAENRLKKNFPKVIIDAETLANDIKDPRTSSADDCWSVIWDKPLFANTKEISAKKKIISLMPIFGGKAWQEIGGQQTEKFRVQYCPSQLVRKGSAKANFKISGNMALEVNRYPHRLAPHRMYAIQTAAIALYNRVKMKGQCAPYKDLTDLDLKCRIEIVKNEMDKVGKFWGIITVLHFLTDLGLACKPDLHLVGAIDRLRIQAGMNALIPGGGVPNLRQSIAVNDCVWDLAKQIYGTPTPQQLRYLDKILMELSKREIV